MGKFDDNKLREKLKIAKEGCDSEFQQYQDLENKCNRYLAFFTILNALMFAVSTVVCNDIVRFLLGLSIFFLMLGLICAYISLKFNDYSVKCLTDRISEKIDSKNNNTELFNYLIEYYTGLADGNYDINMDKSKWLKRSYWSGFIALSIIFLIEMLIIVKNLIPIICGVNYG